MTLIEELRIKFSGIKEVLAVFLYGSYARGDYSKRHSDFDLFVIMDSLKKKGIVEGMIIPLGIKQGIKIHLEFQGQKITNEDQTLLQKMLEEGKLIYSKGLVVFAGKEIGLKPFYIYNYRQKDRVNGVKLSQALHGKKSWYYKGKEKIVKEYKGIIDNENIIELGRGALMISAESKKDIEQLFDSLNIDYKVKKIVFI